MRRVALLTVVFALLVAACAVGGSDAEDDRPADESTTTTAADDDSDTTVPSTEPGDETTSTTEAETEGASNPSSTVPADDDAASTGEVPGSLINDIMGDAAGRANVAASSIAIVRAESVVWADGGLGCPEPGESYTQAPVDGYWIVLDVGGEEYDYRATATGFYRLCTERDSAGPTG